MKRLTALGIAALAGLAGLSSLGPSAKADQPLAGASLFAVSHGQPVCTTRAALQALLDAQIAHADLGFGAFPNCRLVPDNDIVAIGQDFAGGRFMHMVRVRANMFPFGQIEGYTFSAGLGAYPVRSTPAHLNPFF